MCAATFGINGHSVDWLAQQRVVWDPEQLGHTAATTLNKNRLKSRSEFQLTDRQHGIPGKAIS